MLNAGLKHGLSQAGGQFFNTYLTCSGFSGLYDQPKYCMPLVS